ENIATEKYLIFITSTFGDGDAPDNGQGFWNHLNSASINLHHLNYAVMALGDSSYAQFCAHGKNLEARLQHLGAKALLDRVDCDTDFEAPAAQWFTRLLGCLSTEKQSDNLSPAASTTP